jgi:hypothetical protein
MTTVLVVLRAIAWVTFAMDVVVVLALVAHDLSQ